MNSVFTKCLLIIAILSIASCASNNKQIYTWGQYENLIYEFHNNESTIEPQTQIQLLRESIATADNNNRKVAPGIYAHLGMLYSSVGESAKAKEYLELERTSFPESKRFIDGMLKRAQITK